MLAKYAKNYLPILSNLYIKAPEGSEQANQRSSIYATIREYIAIAPQQLVTELFDFAFQLHKKQADSFVKEAILDILRAYLPYQNEGNIDKLYREMIKELASKDHTAQKKAYRMLEELCKSDGAGCTAFVRSKLAHPEDPVGLQRVFLRSLSKANPASQATRLKCLHSIVARLVTDQDEEAEATEEAKAKRVQFVKTIVPEAVMCFNAVNSKARLAAVDMVKCVGEALLQWAGEEEEAKDAAAADFVATLSAGLAGDPTLVHCSLLALATVVFEFRDVVPEPVTEMLLENVSRLATCSSREVVASCLSFVKVFIQVYPVVKIGREDVLKRVMSCVLDMTEDCKKHFRQKTREILDKLTRKFGYEVIAGLVPANDEITLKRLKNLHKEQTKKAKERENRKNAREEEEEEDDIAKPGKAKTMEEIMAEEEMNDEDDVMGQSGEEEKGRKRKKKKQTFISEDQQIVDFLDPSAANKVSSVRPDAGPGIGGQEKKAKEKNGGFELAPDGRLLIKDSDDEEEEDGRDDLEDEDNEGDKSLQDLMSSSRKRKHGTSVASSRKSNQRPMKYQAGGSGIHRPLQQKDASTASNYGSEYRSAKAPGDVKRKGKPDPYAYVPLQKGALNKRKKQKFEGQFKNLVQGAKKGAQSGGRKRSRSMNANMRRLSI